MYITAGVFNILLKQFEDIAMSDSGVLFSLKTAPLTAKIDAKTFGSFIESIVAKKGNRQIGLERGFLMPITITGIIYQLYQNCNTIGEIFEKSDIYSPIVNTISEYTSRTDSNYFYHELLINKEFSQQFPEAAKQLYEAQYGISLQLLYSLTGKRIKPVEIYSVYGKEESGELENYLACPISYKRDKFTMIFHKSILELPILTANKELLPVVENLINEIQEDKKNSYFSLTVSKFLMQGISKMDLSLKSIAWRFNMSERNLQRKLRSEGTSYQDVLNRLRVRLTNKYLKENVPLFEITFLLGFESQSAFNKFFRKHFGTNPRKYMGLN